MLADTLAALLDIQALQNQDAEDRYITDDVSWHDYEVLLAKRGDSPGCRVIYLDRVLEIVAPMRLDDDFEGHAIEVRAIDASSLGVVLARLQLRNAMVM
jgi:hypothetical protein